MKSNRVLLLRSHRRGALLEPFLRRMAAAHLRGLKLTGCELSISLVSDAQIRRINAQWRHKDQATDVLSFPLEDTPLPGERRALPGERRVLGDVIVSLDTAERQARERGVSLKDELARYLAHGLLHLLGHDHHRAEPRRKMAALEARLLGEPGLIPAARAAGARAGGRRQRTGRAVGARRSVAR